MNLRRRLALAFLAILTLFALNLGIYFWGSARRDASLVQLQSALERQVLVTSLRKDLLKQNQNVTLLAIALADAEPLAPEEFARLIEQLEDLDHRITRLRDLAGPAGLETAELLKHLWQRLREERMRFYEQLRVGVPSAPAAVATEEAAADAADAAGEEGVTGVDLAASLYPRVDQQLATIESQEVSQVELATQAFREVTQLTHRMTLLIFLVSSVVAVLVAIIFSAYLARGLKALEAGARWIGRGELDHRIAILHRDELGELARAFNDMAANLLEARSRVEEARAAAERANEAKSSFLANMSHELRTPMNAILGYSEILLEDAEGEERLETAADLRKILSAGRHLLALINEVLDLSKIEAGKMTLYLESFSVERLVEDVVATIRPLVDENRNHLVVELAPALGSIYADETKVRQTLFNLLSNACKFTHGGLITVRARRGEVTGGERLLFEVSDTGIGMTPEEMSKVFEEFTQASGAATSRKFGGTGLGLTISKKFCELMGGDIRVESTVGQGSTFTVELPVEVAPLV